MQFHDSKLLIFAKAPVAGLAKTRLAPLLGHEGAADLYARLLSDTVTKFSRQADLPIECWCAPDTDHPLFDAFSREHGIGLKVQQGADLGERMAFAAADALVSSDAVVLIGGDCPQLSVNHLRQTLQWLHQSADAVLGPAEDGGYVLLGLKRFDNALFREIPWGGSRVLELTRQRLDALGWSWQELDTLWDIDRPEDLERYQQLTGTG